ncbi:phosphatase PAP2 family protein [Daeguia caeni]|uniref:Phosphatase PAP2 family protein n=1 Tax=Daeguia caeni TaxID=439612 RepID=A0ABV9H3C3_9HYPH
MSRHFFSDGAFQLAKNSVFATIRDIHRNSQVYLLAGSALGILAYALLAKRHPMLAPHKFLFILLTFALGPGLLVQIMKIVFSRPRPGFILEFGGDLHFSPAWHLGGECTRYCSFPSGESAVAIAMLSVLVFFPIAWRWLAALVLVPLMVFVSFNRVMLGAHFLSDVTLAWFVMIPLMLWIWSVLSRNRDRIDDAVWKAGEKMRARLHGTRS